jgi:predicted Rossmann-fold nucleotide-binding protein
MRKKRLANEVGTAIAELGYHLLTGGGGGSMEAVGQAFLEKKRKLLEANRPGGNLISILGAKELPQKRAENEPGNQTRTMDLAR